MKKLRFSKETMILPCYTNYDPTRDKEVEVPKSAEIQLENGDWKPYPIVRWVDTDAVLWTEVLVVREDGIYEMASTNGVPDGKLHLAAEKAGLLVDG